MLLPWVVQIPDDGAKSKELKYALIIESELLCSCEFKLAKSLPLVKDSCNKRHMVSEREGLVESPIDGTVIVNDNLEPDARNWKSFDSS